MAWPNKSRTRDAPTPTNISTKSEPEMLKKGTPASPATALASKVLPVPGGPSKRTPLGIRAPKFVYFSGDFKKSTISAKSSFSSFKPATSLKVTFLVLVSTRSFTVPKFIMGPPPPAPFWAPIHIKKMNKPTPVTISKGSTLPTNQLSFSTALMTGSMPSSRTIASDSAMSVDCKV